MNYCSIDGCDDPVKAHGLCAKHYMRLRRNGDARAVKPPGPQASEHRRAMRYTLREMSDRTFARYLKSVKMIRACGGDAKQAVSECARPNGSINVSKLERLAEGMLLREVLLEK